MPSGAFATSSSAVHSRSPYQFTPDGFHPAFSAHAHHPGHWTTAAGGGLDPDPVARVRGACPHLLCSFSCVKRPYRPPFAPRGAQCRNSSIGWDDGADRASNDADVSIVPPKIPYGGFSPVRLHGWPIRRGLP